MKTPVYSRLRQNREIRLLVRADDMGSCHAANEACIQCFRKGIVRSVEVMVPGPWYAEAVKMLKENPDLDVGVHLTLTSEWEFYKWGPVTHAPSLVDKHGHFFPMNSQRPDFPPNTGFLDAKPKLDEVEKELDAQIEIALTDLPQTSHLSLHMNTAGATPELTKIVKRLSEEYYLPLEAPMAKAVSSLGMMGETLEKKELLLIKIIKSLTPGTWIVIDHPGLDSEEMSSWAELPGTGSPIYGLVNKDRAAITQAFTSDRVKQAIHIRGIHLINHKDYYTEKGIL